ncbi:HAD family hydrolase [Bosea sp. BIWAKO-01]|uniref:HAD family hydrolase n=1 Tax=Bosea sp. BIWAKO-01 TaxID=506668 RepID=UPI000A030E22|nr:HAD family hydrolase [Bosea sp. BIWAKO-01]
MSEIRAICFDAFGTLLEIVDKRRPFGQLMNERGTDHRAVDVLTRPLSLREVAKELAIVIGEARLQELELDLDAERASIQLRPGMAVFWAALRRADLRIGVCSNLAQPYAEPLLAILPGIPDALVLSFEVGFIKPQPEIFHCVREELGLRAEQILFIGDTPEADILGPRAVGMHAMTIDAFEAAVNGCEERRISAEEVQSPEIHQLLERVRECVYS